MKDNISGDDLLSGDVSQMREENDLTQMYKVADFVNNHLSNSTKQWLKAKYQLMCAKSLLKELDEQDKIEDNVGSGNGGQATHANQVSKIPREKVKLLADMLKPINSTFLTYEDHWNGMIYDDRDKKNMITSLNHQELLGLTQLRLKYIRFFVDLCRQGLDYEPIKEIYKKKLHAFKQVDQVASGSGPGHGPADSHLDHQSSTICNGTMLFELKILFDLSKNMYIEVLSSFIENQLVKYMQVRKTVMQAQEKSQKGAETENKWKTQSLKQARDIFDRMRREYQVTKDNVPQQLKEIFDIFVEIHSKKGFLVTRKLISDDHRRMIIQSVLNSCAMCGPDNFNPSTQAAPDNEKGARGKPYDAALKTQHKSQVKFLDLHKLSAADY